MSVALPDFSRARVLVVGDGESMRFGHASDGMAGIDERPAACGRAAHGAERPDR